MTEIREYIHTALIGDAEIKNLVQDRVVAFSGEMKPLKTPFIVHKFTVASPYSTQWRGGPKEQNVQFWIHDKPGDYANIDALMARVNAVLLGLQPQNGFLESRHALDSSDMQDPAMGTIVRYCTHQLTLSS